MWFNLTTSSDPVSEPGDVVDRQMALGRFRLGLTTDLPVRARVLEFG